MNVLTRWFLLWLSPLFPLALVAGAVSVPASDSRFVYEGRFDESDPAGRGVVWQASRIRFGFSGDSVTLRFSNLKGQVFFNVSVDGAVRQIGLREGAAYEQHELHGFGPGRHQAVLFKRSEAAAGTVRFDGVSVPDAEQLQAGAKPNYARRFLFIGDSITVGACNEDGPKDQWEDRSTHNAALSYAALTADAFQADHENIAVSGMGIAAGWVPPRAGATWDRLYPDPRSLRANLSRWTPDVVFLNFGENDDSFTRARNQPFPASFVDDYVSLVREVRAAFPSARIVILRGGMPGGARSERLRTAWEQVVARCEKDDRHVRHFVFSHWSETHPRVADDHAMADELVAWLKAENAPERK
jgi:lysophospholipase L1-like esterase